MKNPSWSWPKKKRIAVVFNVCLEAWSDGKAPGISPMGNPLPAGVLDTMAISWAAYGVKLPLLFMNCFRTHDDTLAALAPYFDLAVAGLVPGFMQNQEPKLRADDLTPIVWPADPSLEWCPPGHGDLYTALVTSGMLDTLREHGYRYAFVSNSDNLGAVLEPRILTWVAGEEVPFAMEVARRTEADRKGGHIARLRGDGLVLRETAQTPEEDLEALQDVGRHRYVNTNNLWIDLEALRRTLAERNGVLGLPIIVNRKTVDPADPRSPAVLQLETAMGAAIGAFERVAAVRVPRSRFIPVKTTNDLLVLRSDVYALGDDGRLDAVAPPPFVDLDPAHFGRLADFERRFPDGPPSLAGCERFVVRGSASFAA